MKAGLGIVSNGIATGAYRADGSPTAQTLRAVSCSGYNQNIRESWLHCTPQVGDHRTARMVVQLPESVKSDAYRLNDT